jgi:hypothetical protein
MRSAIILCLSCFLLFIGCQERDTEMNIGHQKSGSLDKTPYDHLIAGESMPAEADQRGIDEKIIKTAYTSIKTSNVMESYDKTLNVVKKYDGIILNSDISRHDGSEQAQMMIKVKPRYFMVFLEELASVGAIESKSITEEDVTEEYFDVRARLANARKVQDRLYGILNKANKVEDILKVENEIERISEKIEVFEGKIKYLDSMVDYSRINITIYSTKRPFIDFGSIGRGFGNAVKYAVHIFFLAIWFIIIFIPLMALVFVLKPVAVFIIHRIKKKK